jgi:hypothetical protein
MRYLLLLYGAPFRPEEIPPSAFEAHMTFSRELHDAGAYVDSAPLAPVETAKTVQIRSGKRLVVDGPFAETKEVLGGYYLIEADSLDAAVDWAQRLRSDVDGSIEVRPVLSIPG